MFLSLCHQSFGGFWVHHVARHLPDPSPVLRLLGYVLSKGVYCLGAFPDVEVLRGAAIDCHIASAECKVLILMFFEINKIILAKTEKQTFCLKK